MTPSQKDIYIEKLTNTINSRELIKVTLISKRKKLSDLKTIIITAVELKKGYSLNFIYRHNTKDITKNYPISEGIALISKALDDDFFNADIFANNENVSFITTPEGKIRIKTQKPTLQPIKTFTHDRVKERLITTKENIYLRELGITNANWEIRREMSDKYIQINRYIELLEPNLRELAFSSGYHVVDMGSGKGYLTFALYDYLTNNLKQSITMTGVEFRADLVSTCTTIAQKANFNKLNFVKGTIADTSLEHIDILIALHACDTATDDAIFRGIQSNASLIVCAPCCHKQIRKEFDVTNELSQVMKFGILKERQAEIITDSLRALLMEAYGYKTKVFEFISSEHTPKNVMIVGQKVADENPNKLKILDTIIAIKKVYGIKKHYLENLLGL
jgi:hypothetical protein